MKLEVDWLEMYPLLAALPGCAEEPECPFPATVSTSHAAGRMMCDDCRAEHADLTTVDLPQAPAVRAIQKAMRGRK